MLKTLQPDELTLSVSTDELSFADTSELMGKPFGWIGQTEAEASARFGLNLRQPNFHLLVLGEPGSGRTSLMLSAMQEAASSLPVPPDLVAVQNFDTPERPIFLCLPAGKGALLRAGLEQYSRQLVKVIPTLLVQAAMDVAVAIHKDTDSEKTLGRQTHEHVEKFLDDQLEILKNLMEAEPVSEGTEPAGLNDYLALLRRDTLDNLEVFQITPGTESEGALEAMLSRYRANLLVDNRHQKNAPVICEDDPSLHALFGGIESGSEGHGGTPDFMHLRAGNLLRAHGGMLMLHLRDILADQHSGSQILEKLHRFLRNGYTQIEEFGTTSGSSPIALLKPEPLPVDVKVVLITTREEFYDLQASAPELASYFRIKVDFAESVRASTPAYQSVAAYIADRCRHFRLKHFSAGAVARLIQVMHRRIEDKTRISSSFGELQGLILESSAHSGMREGGLVSVDDVEAAILAGKMRHGRPERQMRDSIINGEQMICVGGRVIGQINGLTHIDMGDASFGSPVRISARCFAGEEGVINIDREVEMTGPNHDKGLFILRSWLSASFSHLTPLSLTASLVFEQEYHGVEGDSASIAELYALLSTLSGLALPQGIAVTGALNQHGEVMPVGGINEKIEGHYRVCKAIGLDGSQGVIIPERNVRHLLLDQEVIGAVAEGKFHIYTISQVLEGLELLTGLSAGEKDASGSYPEGTIMRCAQNALEKFRKIMEANQPPGH